MNFDIWKETGTDFLIKTNINNWISCSEDGGSLVNQREGGLICNVEKVIVPGVCEQVRPYRLVAHSRGTSLYASGHYYYLETTNAEHWPVADPCGTTAINHRNDVYNPSGWIYLRPEQTPNISVHHVYDTANPTGKVPGLKIFV